MTTVVRFRESETIAALGQLFLSLLGELENKGVLTRPDTVAIFDRTAAVLRGRTDRVNTKAAAFVDTLSSFARSES